MNEKALRERRQKGMELTLADQFVRLRINERKEVPWLILYWVATLLLIDYFTAWDNPPFSLTPWEYDYPRPLVSTSSAVWVSLLHLLVSLWLLRWLALWRQRTYDEVRAIRRAQSYFRICDDDFTFLKYDIRNRPFPMEFGSGQARPFDFTNSFRWYRRRALWLAILNLGLIYVVFKCAASENWLVPVIIAIVVHLFAGMGILVFDNLTMKMHLEDERNLVGANEDDYPIPGRG